VRVEDTFVSTRLAFQIKKPGEQLCFGVSVTDGRKKARMNAEGGTMSGFTSALIVPPSALQTLLRVSNPIMATKIVAPMIDQMIGNLVPPMSSAKSSGSLSERASHMPIIAPMKPSAMETRQPPREKPLMACPSEPHNPAIRSKITISTQVIETPPTKSRSQESGVRRKENMQSWF
jgi:hypothetical protein